MEVKATEDGAPTVRQEACLRLRRGELDQCIPGGALGAI